GLWAVTAPAPDVFIASDGRTVAVRGNNDRLAVIKNGSDSFALREWLAADGDPRAPDDDSLRDGATCDASGCVARMKGGKFVTLALSPEGYADDCRPAALLVTPGIRPRRCAAVTSDRSSLQQTRDVSPR